MLNPTSAKSGNQVQAQKLEGAAGWASGSGAEGCEAPPLSPPLPPLSSLSLPLGSAAIGGVSGMEAGTPPASAAERSDPERSVAAESGGACGPSPEAGNTGGSIRNWWDQAKELLDSANERGGLDYLEVSLYGQWSKPAFHRLAAALDARREGEGEESAAVVFEIEFGDERFYLHRYGRRTGKGKGKKGQTYKYVLEWKGIEFWILNRWDFSDRVPLVRVVASSWPCMALTGAGVWREAQAFLARLGFDFCKNVVSRADMAVDLPGLETDKVIRLVECEDLGVTRARKAKAIREGRRYESLYIGAAGAPLMLRIYDKRRELVGSGRDGKNSEKAEYLIKNRWGGRDPGEATRVEFQLRRSALRDRGISSVEDLLAKAPGLWEYLTTEWFRVVQRLDRAGHRSHLAELHEVWELVLRAGHLVGWLTHEAVGRVRKRTTSTAKMLWAQALGCISKALAVVGRLEEVPQERWRDEAAASVYEVLRESRALRKFLEGAEGKRAEAEAGRSRVVGFGAEDLLLTGVPF